MAKKTSKPQLVGTSIGGGKPKAYFEKGFGTCKNQPMLAVQDATGRIQCFESKDAKKLKQQGEEMRKLGFTVLIGVG